VPLHWFHPPVPVEDERLGLVYHVTSVEKAAEFLLVWDELGQGPAWRKAVEACMAAVDGSGSPDAAREAFEAAARECGKLMS
jgi:hypothetical protein